VPAKTAELINSLMPKVKRKLVSLGAVNDMCEPTGKPVKLSEADEDELGVTSGHLKQLKELGVLL